MVKWIISVKVQQVAKQKFMKFLKRLLLKNLDRRFDFSINPVALFCRQ